MEYLKFWMDGWITNNCSVRLKKTKILLNRDLSANNRNIKSIKGVIFISY